MYSQSVYSNPIRTVAPVQEINFYGAAIVNEDGIEIPITAEMVERALMHPYGSVGTLRENHGSN
jgi:hypothetical protein